jgi:hypothetical protein
MAIKTFTTGEVLTAADTNTYLANSGLVYVAGTTFATTATPFINGCFSSSFQNYRVILNIEGTDTTNLRMRVRSGTSTPETGNIYSRWGFSVLAGVVTNETSGGQSSLFLGSYFSGEQTPLVFDLFSPNLAIRTNTLPYSWSSSTGGTFFMPGRVTSNTVYTGIEIFGDSGTLTGSMRVYGYRQA